MVEEIDPILYMELWYFDVQCILNVSTMDLWSAIQFCELQNEITSPWLYDAIGTLHQNK